MFYGRDWLPESTLASITQCREFRTRCRCDAQWPWQSRNPSTSHSRPRWSKCSPEWCNNLYQGWLGSGPDIRRKKKEIDCQLKPFIAKKESIGMDRNKQWQIFQITNQIWMIFVPAIAVSIRQGHVGIVPPKEKFHLLGAPNKDISRMHPPCGYMYIYLYIYLSIYLSIYLYL